MTPNTQPSGILVINKPSGFTSHDVVNVVRRLFNTRKVGHAGTLDPMATGVLILLIGKSTKASEALLNQDKTYRATITFGQQTDTGDADGQVINTDDASWLTQFEVEKVLPLLVGSRDQMVPAYSAVKVQGQKLYNMARSGKPLADRPLRHITIQSIDLRQFSPTQPFPSAEIDVHCSKGTYIRVLAEEISDKIGVPGHLSALERRASGNYTIEQAVDLETLKQAESSARLDYLLPTPA